MHVFDLDRLIDAMCRVNQPPRLFCIPRPGQCVMNSLGHLMTFVMYNAPTTTASIEHQPENSRLLFFQIVTVNHIAQERQ